MFKPKLLQEVFSVIPYPNYLWMDPQGNGSGIIFRATTSATGTVTFKVRDSTNQEYVIGTNQAKLQDNEKVAKLTWWGTFPDGSRLGSGTFTVIAEMGSSRKEAHFEVKYVDANLVGLGEWMKDTKDPGAVLPKGVWGRKCPTCPWEQMLDLASGFFSAISVNDPVNVVSGNLCWPEVDFSLNSRMPITMARIYNSLDPHVGPFGQGWSSPYLSRLEFLASDVVFVNSDGSRVLFKFQDSKFVPALSGTELNLALATDTGYWSLKHPYGSEWNFDSDGKIIRMTRACCGQGAADATVIDYSTDGKLQRVTNPAGQWIEFSYSGDRITTITDVSNRIFSFSFDSLGNLQTFRDAIGRVTNYSYSEEGFLNRIEQPGNRVTTIGYADRRVVSTVNPDGTTSTFNWDLNAFKLTLTDNAGTLHEYQFSPSWRLIGYSVPSAGISKNFLSSGTALTGYENALGVDEIYNYGTNSLLLSKTDGAGYSTVFEYDSRFRLPTRLKDSLNREWQYEWDQRGNLIKVIDPDGRETHYGFDSHNNKISETDPKGRITRYQYDTTGNQLVAIIDPMGDVTSFTYDLRGNKISYKNPLGQVTVKEFDVLDRETKSISSDGRWVKKSYDSAGNVALVEESDGTRTSRTYDNRGRILTETNSIGAVTRFIFDSSGRRTQTIDPLENVTRTEYDELGRVTKTVYPDGTSNESQFDKEGRAIAAKDACGAITRYEFDAMGRQTAVVDAIGNRTVTEFDLAGRTVSQTDTLGHKTRFYYDSNDRLVKTVFPDNSESSNIYDIDGRLIQSIDQLGQITKYEYNQRGQQVKKILPNGAVTERVYNGMGHEIETRDALGRRTVNLYDSKGRPYMTVNPASGTTQRFWDPISGLLIAEKKADGSITSTTYDILDRPVIEFDAMGASRSFEFDLAGRQVAVADALNRRTISVFDNMNRETQTADAEGHVIRRSFDPCGRPVSLTDGAGRIWRWEYNLLGQVIAEIDPLGNRVSFGYNGQGQIVTKTNARGQIIRFFYNVMDRLERVEYPDNTIATISYDLLGRELVRCGPAGAVFKTYDSVSNLVSESFSVGAGLALPGSKSWKYEFDLVGNCTKALSPENETLLYKYNVLNQLVEMDLVEASSGRFKDVITYQLDPVGRVLVEERPGVKTTNTFDPVGRMLSTRHERASGREKIVSSRRYTFNAVGDCLIMADETGAQTAYQYNNVDWLTSVQYPDGQKVSYSFNGGGDRITETSETPTIKKVGRNTVISTDTLVIPFGYDPGGRMISRASDTFVFDADGNQISAIENGEETRYVWSSDNRLLRVEKDLECQKHNKKKCGKCPQVLNFTLAEDYGYVPEDWRRLTRSITAPEGRGLGHGTGHDCDEIPGDGKGHHKAGRESATFVSVYQGQDESHEYSVVGAQNFAPGKGKCDKKYSHDCHKEKCDFGGGLHLVRSFIGGPGTDDLELTKYHGRNLWHLKDMLGSTIGLTNRSGHPIAKIGYDAWGNFRYPDKPGHGIKPCKDEELDDLLDRFDSGRSMGFDHGSERFGRHFGKMLSPYLYTGRRWSNFTNLYFNRNRYYSPQVGRFTSHDPWGFSGGKNLWGYVGNNPIIRNDPLGLFSLLIYNDFSPSNTDLAKATQHRLLFRDEMPWTVRTSEITPTNTIDRVLFQASMLGPIRYFIYLGHGDVGQLTPTTKKGPLEWVVCPVARPFFGSFESNGQAILFSCRGGEPGGIAQQFSIEYYVETVGGIGPVLPYNGQVAEPTYGIFALNPAHLALYPPEQLPLSIKQSDGTYVSIGPWNVRPFSSVFLWALLGDTAKTYAPGGIPK